MSKKILTKVMTSVLSASLLITSFAGCKKSETSKNQTKEKKYGVYDVSKPVEFNVYWNYSWYNSERKWGETTISKAIEEKLNCKINFLKPDGDPAEKLNVMLTSGELPDVIIMDRDANYKKMIELGMFIPLDDYIAKYPGYRSAVEESTINFAKVNGKVYSLLNWPTTSDHPTGNAAWFINEEIYKQLGSPEIKTLDDLLAYTKKVKDSGIKIGGKDVVPMQFDPGSYQNGLYQLYNSYGGVGSVTEDMVYQPDGSNELKFFMNDKKWEDTMVFANKMWNAGVMNSDYFVETAQQKDDKRNSGRVAVYVSSNGVNEARDGMNSWKTTDPNGKYIVIEPPAALGVQQKDVMTGTFNRLGWNSICITKSAKDPERIFEVLDWIASNEGQLITFHGPKGVLWDELDSNGYPVIKKNRSDLNDKEGKDLACEVFSMPGMSKWVDESKVAADNRKPETERDFVIQAQSKIAWKHSEDVTEFTGLFTDPNTDEGIAFTQVQDLVRTSIPKIVMAKDEAEARKLVKDTIDQAYKLGFDKVEKFKTSKWKENLKALGK